MDENTAAVYMAFFAFLGTSVTALKTYSNNSKVKKLESKINDIGEELDHEKEKNRRADVLIKTLEAKIQHMEREIEKWQERFFEAVNGKKDSGIF